MKQILLCISILLSTAFCQAQEFRIIKDNVNCSYGLKDKNGNWFIEPIYILIQEYSSGYFLMKDVLGDGLLSPSGKWVIECKYDQLYPAQPKWQIIGENQQGNIAHPPGTSFFFHAHSGDQKILLNSRGKQIAAFSKLETLEFDGNAHLLIYGNLTSTTSYLDTTGKILINKLPGEILPFGQNEFSLSGKKAEAYSKVMTGNVRLINRKGEYPLTEQFDRAILASDNRICFEVNSKYGEMTTGGTLLIEPKFRRKVRLSSSPHQKGSWEIYSETDKVGLMKPDGTVILKPIYDEVKRPNWNSDMERLWLVNKAGLVGVFDDEGKMILPVRYDEITFIHDNSTSEQEFRTNFIVEKDGKFAYLCPTQPTTPNAWYDGINAIYDSYHSPRVSFSVKLITKQNGKFGILNVDGTVQSKCIYDGHAERRTSSKSHFFWKDLDVLEFNFSSANIKPTKWAVHFASERFILFTDSRSYIAGTLSENGLKLRSLDARDQRYNFLGNMMIVNRATSSEWEIYHTKTQEKIELKNVANITAFSSNRFLLQTRKNRFGIINEDGKLIVDPIFLEFKQNYKSTHTWASTGKNEIGEDRWILIDENGAQVFSDTVTETFRVNSGDFLITVDDKTGLFDTETFNWKIEPNYPCLFKSFDDYYIAAFAQNKKGILRADGTLLLPFDYQFIQVIASDRYENRETTQNTTPEIRWLAKSRRGEILVDQNGNQLSSAQSIRAFKESLLFGDTSFLDSFMGNEPKEISKKKLISLNQSNGIQLVQESLFYSLTPQKTENVRNFPSIDYSNIIPISNELTQVQIRTKKRAIWSNPDLKRCVFDSINAHWNGDQDLCTDLFGRSLITVKQEKTIAQEFKDECNCSKQKYSQNRGYNFHSQFYRLDSIGKQFVSITYGYHPIMDDRFMTMSQPPPPPPPAEHINVVYKNGKAISIQLNDIFQSDSILLQEFILALQQRDDLKLDCSSLETMISTINGRFSLSKEGVRLYYHGFDNWSNQAIEFLIPLERLKLHNESEWIVSILEK